MGQGSLVTERARLPGACDGGQPRRDPARGGTTSLSQPAVAEHAVSNDTHTSRHVPVTGCSGPFLELLPLAPGGPQSARRAFPGGTAKHGKRYSQAEITHRAETVRLNGLRFSAGHFQASEDALRTLLARHGYDINGRPK